MRLASAEDVDAIVALVNRCYRGDESQQGWTTEAEFLGGQRIDGQMLLELLDESDVSILLWSKEDGSLQATCECRLFPDEQTAELGMICVSPESQGSGIGREVLAESELFAKEKLGARQSRMWVISLRDSLIQWYQRRGYHVSGVRRNFPMNDPKYGLPKVKKLEFLELLKEL